MIPVRSIKNQYRGINAHMHSLWQAEHKWNNFHNVHIADLVVTLKAQLFPMGYTATVEDSLQIRRLGNDITFPRADIIIRDKDLQRAMTPVVETSGQVYPVRLNELLEDDEDLEHPYYAVVIYERGQANSGAPIAWLELLSPSNKGDSRDAIAYRNKRRDLVRSDVVFVELDYLHLTPGTFWRFGDYTRNEPDSHPYRVFVLNPHPAVKDEDIYLKQFDVDQELPSVIIPLSGKDRLNFNFGIPYRKTFEEMLYGLEDVDYTQLPLNFERYSQADQTRIVNRMLAVLQASKSGIDLETSAPLPIENPVSLDDGLKQLAAFA